MKEKNKLILVLDNIRSVQNVASIFRTADGFGVDQIYLIGQSPTPIDRFGRSRADFSKISLGAEKFIDYLYFEDIKTALAHLKQNGFEIIAIEQSKNATDVYAFKKIDSNKVAVILGNEVSGLTLDVLEKADQILEIKMLGKKESFNVSVIAGIVLFQIRSFFD